MTYFRAIIQCKGQFLFRTSKLHTAAAMLEVHDHLTLGFGLITKEGLVVDDSDYSLQILAVVDGVGTILTPAQINEQKHLSMADGNL